MNTAEVIDKVIGKGAALLLVHFGAKRVHGSVMSDLAIKVSMSEKTNYSFDLRVDRIECKTEVFLLNIDDPQKAYQLLRQRAERC